MKKRRILQSILGAVALLAWSLLGTVPSSQAAPKTVTFIATDEPGSWFKCVSPFISVVEGGCVPKSVALSDSVALLQPGDTVQIDMGTGTSNSGVDTTNAVHTFTSLLWPLRSDSGHIGQNAVHMPYDQPNGAFRGNLNSVTLETPGLYVIVCKLHPFMLAAAIVDQGGLNDGVLDLGERIRLISYQGLSFPTKSDLAVRLLRAFFLITNTANYQDHRLANWNLTLPALPVRIYEGVGTNAGDTLQAGIPSGPVLLSALNITAALLSLHNPAVAGIGEIWVDVEFEKTQHKTKPGTAIAVDAATWKVTKRVALPDINMNNPHNMWTDRDQTRIYQTQWFGNELTVFNRSNGRLVRNITVGPAPAHVMTRVDTDQVHVSLNGANAVVELNPGNLTYSRSILTQGLSDLPAQPHAHTMSFDGKTMVTPNSNTNDSTRIDVPSGDILGKEPTGTLPIATGMMPDASKYYVSNYLDSTITCISIGLNACNDGVNNKVGKKTIPLLLGGGAFNNYNPWASILTGSMAASGALPIQTPVSPDGKYVVTANTLSGTITIIDTASDELIAVLPCSAGCHGVNFGAKKGGGYYAYVSSKFSNDLIIVDLDSRTEAGRILLVAESGANLQVSDDTIDSAFNGLAGQGGQGVLPIPHVNNDWVQNLPNFWKHQLTNAQRHPFPLAE
jgi:DNA-binding beta-propeller fold protein YncE